MDCLDRTNVVQSMLARYTLNKMFHDLGILSPSETFKVDTGFEFLFRNIWADNADVVSKSYSGTGALKTDFTRLGIRTKRGALQDGINSVTRYAKNNFLDGPKQDAFDLFLGVHTPDERLGGSVFVDRRPVLIQAVPYLSLFSSFMVFIGFVTKTGSRTASGAFTIFWAVVAGWTMHFIWRNGMLYVSLSLFITQPS
jgi:hypothetical protein